MALRPSAARSPPQRTASAASGARRCASPWPACRAASGLAPASALQPGARSAPRRSARRKDRLTGPARSASAAPSFAAGISDTAEERGGAKATSANPGPMAARAAAQAGLLSRERSPGRSAAAARTSGPLGPVATSA